MLKRILIMCLAIWAFSTGIYAEEDDRWVWVSSDSWYSNYIDKNTVSSQTGNDKVIFWEKTTELNGKQHLSKIMLNRNTMTYVVQYRKNIQENGITASEKYSFSSPKLIYPDTVIEKAANAALHELKLPSIYGVAKHQWKWFYSSAECDYYICTDAYQYDSSKKIFNVFIRYTFNGKTWYGYEGIDLNNHTVVTNGKRKMLVPDSFEEALYNAAKSVI